MHRIGIDIGTTKTVIYSSKSNGTVVTDEFDKRELATVMELTTPKRSFGKGCSSDSTEHINLRVRNFISNINTPEGRKCTFMYLQYLHRILVKQGGYKTAVLCIPDYFSTHEKTVFRAIADKSSLNVTGFFTQMTAIGSFAGLLAKTVPETFMIIDFGSHKTSVGTFKMAGDVLEPTARFCVKKGASDFDEAIFRIFCKKYCLSDSPVMRERILAKSKQLKMAMNTIASTTVSILSEDYKTISLELTQDEYLSSTKCIIEEISAFIKGVFEKTQFKGHVEVVGKNMQNAFVRNILSGVDNFTTLHAAESAAHGACLALAVNSSPGIKYKVKEIVGREITTSLGEENVVIFKPTDFIGEKKTIKLSFVDELEICEDGFSIGKLMISDYEGEITLESEITLEAEINSFGIFTVTSITSNKVCVPFEYDTFSMAEQELDDFVKEELRFLEIEQNCEKAGEIRNTTETIFDNLGQWLNDNFPDILDADEMNRMDKIIDDYFSIPITKEYESELKNAKEAISHLSFVDQKLFKQKNILSNKLNEAENKIRVFLAENKYNTPSTNALHGGLISVKNALKSLAVSIETSLGFSSSMYQTLLDTQMGLILKAEGEIKAMKEAEEKARKFEENRKAVEAEKKKAEGAKSTEEVKDTTEAKGTAVGKKEDVKETEAKKSQAEAKEETEANETKKENQMKAKEEISAKKVKENKEESPEKITKKGRKKKV